MRMPRLFSYVVDHDYGYAPCPFGDLCTLAKCKYGTIKCKSGTRRNIVELAEEGDWIAETGGVDLGKSAGHGRLIYAMRVDEKITLREYCEGNQGNRIDADFDIPVNDRFALLSYHYGNMVGRNGTPLVAYFAESRRKVMAGQHVHVDPEWETLTYGDPTPPKRSLRYLKPGHL